MAIESGVDAVFYWDMTYREIITAIEGYQKRFKNDLQIQAMLIYKMGELVGIAVNEPKKYPKNAKEAFKKTGIFDNSGDEEIKKQDWQIMKERVNRYAYLKKKRGESI